MGRLRDLGLAGLLSTGVYAGMVLVPAGAAVLIWLVPLPGLLFAAVYPREVALWLIVTALALAIGLNVASSIAFATTVGAATLMIAFGITRSWTLDRTVASALGVWVVGVGALYVLTAGGLEPAVTAARGQVDQAFAVALEASKGAGADQKALALLETERTALVDSVLHILPGLVALTGGAILSVNLAIARKIAPAFAEFALRFWRAPDGLIWVFIAAGFGMFLVGDGVGVAASNVFVVLLGCYFLQGLAIVAYYLDRFGLPMSLRIGTYMLIAIQQLLAAVVLALGIFDLWGDFRRLHTPAADASLGSDGD